MSRPMVSLHLSSLVCWLFFGQVIYVTWFKIIFPSHIFWVPLAAVLSMSVLVCFFPSHIVIFLWLHVLYVYFTQHDNVWSFRLWLVTLAMIQGQGKKCLLLMHEMLISSYLLFFFQQHLSGGFNSFKTILKSFCGFLKVPLLLVGAGCPHLEWVY